MSNISRRNLFAITVAGAVALGRGASAQASGGTQPKRTVAYQPSPNNGKQCGGCKLFRTDAAGSRCVVVEGPIASTGWCVLYESRPG